MTGSITGLVVGAIVGGRALSWLLFPSPVIICLSPFFKLLALIIRFTGGVVGYMLNIIMVRYSLKSIEFYPLISFAGSMWFIPFLSTHGVSKWALKVGSLYHGGGDRGWLEYYGSQGSYKSFIIFSNKLQVAQDNNVKIYIILIVL